MEELGESFSEEVIIKDHSRRIVFKQEHPLIALIDTLLCSANSPIVNLKFNIKYN